MLEVVGSKVSRSSRCSRNPYRWRVSVLALVIPGILCASVVKFARASSYKAQPIVSDGIDDDVDASVVCVLPEDTAKKLSLTSVTALPGRKLSSPSIIRPRLAQLETHLQPFSNTSLRSNRLRTQHAPCPDDPDGAH